MDEIMRMLDMIIKKLNRRSVSSPWLNGIQAAAGYAHMREGCMRRLVKGNVIVSRMKPKDESGRRPRGVLVYAPSIDEYLMSQPSGACEMALAMSELEQ